MRFLKSPSLQVSVDRDPPGGCHVLVSSFCFSSVSVSLFPHWCLTSVFLSLLGLSPFLWFSGVVTVVGTVPAGPEGETEDGLRSETPSALAKVEIPEGLA